MKRGLITWDKAEIPPAVFDQRIEGVKKVLRERGLPALVVYSELWRSNQARFFANYMPYFNRAFLILPLEGKPTLLCGLSPRTYRWIQSVTPIEDVRSAGNFVKPLTEIAAERGWNSVGVLDADQFPFDLAKALRGGSLPVVNVESAAVFNPSQDDTELTMRRKAAALARAALTDEREPGIGITDHALAGVLEGRLRRAGAEDVVLLFTNGDGPPAPAKGQTLTEDYSLSLALEYRGHWVHITRSRNSDALSDAWDNKLETLTGGTQTLAEEGMCGSYPWEYGSSDGFMALHVEIEDNGSRLFYGETCWRGPKGWEVL